MPILIDWSQTIIAGALSFSSDFDKGKDAKKMTDIIRHTVLTTLLSHKSKFGPKFGDIVITCDGQNYWRKEIFPQYKFKRKGSREESKTDWDAIFTIATQLREEFQEVFPYKIIRVNRAEADDVIAVITKYLQSNELEQSGVFDEEPQNILILSSDGDFKQLHKYKGVRQWNPLMKKFVDKAEKHFLLEKILTGDTGDGIPNIRSTDNQLVEGVRQPPITAKIKQAAIDLVESDKQIVFEDQDMLRNFQRNQRLIDFDYIPEDLEKEIIQVYKDTQVSKDKNKIFNYFIKHRCKNLMSQIQEF